MGSIAKLCLNLSTGKARLFKAARVAKLEATFRSLQMCDKAKKEDEELQINALIYAMGKEAEHIFKAFTFEEGCQKKFNVVSKKFEEHFVPKRNIIHERACFHRRVQKDGESVEAFIRNLYELAEHCEFGPKRDGQIRDRIVIGILDKSLSQKLQMKSDLNLDMAIQMARQSEQVKVQVAGQVDDKYLREVNRKNHRPNANRRQGPTQRGKYFRRPGVPSLQPCSRCNRPHKSYETWEPNVLNARKRGISL